MNDDFVLSVSRGDATQTLTLTDTVLSLSDEAIGRFVQVMVETIKNPRPQ